MKVSKFRFAVLVLLAVTVFYAVVLYQNIQAYSEYKRSVIEKHPEIEPYIDFAPFWVSSYGAPCLLVGIMLTMFWIGLLASLKANIKRKIIGGITLLICIGCAFVFPVAYANPETVHVDVFCVADEE